MKIFTIVNYCINIILLVICVSQIVSGANIALDLLTILYFAQSGVTFFTTLFGR